MPIRVLALCGFTQNATIYFKQLGAIRKACKDVEFVFLEPPIIVEQADMPWNQNLSEFDSSATTEKAEQTPETTPRAWWTTNGDRTIYRLWLKLPGKGFDETVQYIHDYLVKSEPFDGIMGFSQGACMAAILGALLTKPGLHPLFPSEPPLRAPKFIISTGGFLPTPSEPSFSEYFPLPSTLPILHIIGRNDTLITEEKTRTLINVCPNSRVEFHEGGHFTPSKANWRKFLNAYITSFAEGGSQGDVPSPSAFGPSGTTTPATSTPRAGSPHPA
ncbi:serine hydrolase FSH [Naematelia encephala]|uniref:Serine hydrolase FSH n=1 Tax=Naematelia encephala TaxID=71784 RepID=A0A1Y2ANI1_9TREE|nr:serine hydrolase FSH [Naematelia encephala]